MNSFETLWNILKNNEMLDEIRNTNELLYNIDINMKKGKLLGELIEMSKVIFEKHGINKDSFHTANIKAEQLKREHNLIELLGDYTADFDKIFSDKHYLLSAVPKGSSPPEVLKVEEVNDPAAAPKVLNVVEVNAPDAAAAADAVPAPAAAAVPDDVPVPAPDPAPDAVPDAAAAAVPDAAPDAAAAAAAVPDAAPDAAAAADAVPAPAPVPAPAAALNRKAGLPFNLHQFNLHPVGMTARKPAAAAAGGTLKKLKRLNKKKPHK